MEEKIDQSERQIRASAEIDEEFTGDRLSKDFKQLEQSAGANDADFRLLQLKQQMGMLGGGAADAKQLGAGAAGAAPGNPALGAGAAGGSPAAAPALPASGGTSGGGGSSSPAAPSADDGIPTADVEELPDTRKPA
jgi:hypothetical protein